MAAARTPDMISRSQVETPGSASRQSFRTPGHMSYRSENSQNSVESPYTSMGSVSSYQRNKSRIHDQQYGPLRARSQKASKFHEVKSQAVLEALASLQDKIKRLELDRAQAEENLKALTSETSGYKDMLKQQSRTDSPVAAAEVSRHPELENQLEEAESRCQLLEKQLEYMRKVMQSQRSVPSNAIPTSLSPRYLSTSTQDPTSGYPTLSSLSHQYPTRIPTSSLSHQHTHPTTSSPTHQQDEPIASTSPTVQFVPPPVPTNITNQPYILPPSAPPNLTSSTYQQSVTRPSPSTIVASPAMEKLTELEREHMRLTASQTLAESKIRDLEEKILEERHHRQLLQDKAAELQTAVSTQSALGTSPTMISQPTPKKKTKKKKRTQSKSKSSVSSSSSAPENRILSPSHYLVDVAHLPFVVGQSTTKSHSLGANIQNVISIMKSHSKLCNGMAIPPSASSSGKSKKKSVSMIDPNDSEEALNDLLLTLQDEFGQLGIEHREIAQQIEETVDDHTREDLERELECILSKLDVKGQQLQTVRNHMKKLKSRKTARSKPAVTNGTKKITIDGSQEIEVVTSIRAKKPEPSSTKATAHPNLEILRKVKKLQTTLRKDDLSWE